MYRFLRILLRLLFRLLYRVKIEGLQHIPAQGPVILCANHISVLDPPFIGTYLNRKLRYLAKAELFEIPVFNRLITYLGAIPVKRGGVSKESIKRVLEILRQGEMICIFPEGTRSGQLAAGKKGAASFALKTGATVIPAVIIGDYKLFRPMKIIYGPPVDLDRYREDDAQDQLEAATEAIMNAIRRLMDQGATFRPNHA
jgi:1-acyl-sn-glycerol-3-phosphate acyltransferase